MSKAIHLKEFLKKKKRACKCHFDIVWNICQAFIETIFCIKIKKLSCSLKYSFWEVVLYLGTCCRAEGNRSESWLWSVQGSCLVEKIESLAAALVHNPKEWRQWEECLCCWCRQTSFLLGEDVTLLLLLTQTSSLYYLLHPMSISFQGLGIELLVLQWQQEHLIRFQRVGVCVRAGNLFDWWCSLNLGMMVDSKHSYVTKV